jgi:hypothetical protein
MKLHTCVKEDNSIFLPLLYSRQVGLYTTFTYFIVVIDQFLSNGTYGGDIRLPAPVLILRVYLVVDRW